MASSDAPAQSNAALTVGAYMRGGLPMDTWMLVGPPNDENEGWSFRTLTTHSLRDEGGALITLDEAFLVYPMRKKPGPFMDTLLIGRTSTNDVVIPDASISKIHARARRAEDGWMLTDAGSSNGTAINNTPVTSAGMIMRHGDRVRFGVVMLQLFEPSRFAKILSTILR